MKDNDFNGLDAFLDYLQKQNIDIFCEDTRKICFSNILSNDLLRQILDQLDTNQRRQAKEKVEERATFEKHTYIALSLSSSLNEQERY